MPTECVFTMPTGRKCRCMATRGHAFCRHHGAPRTPGRARRDPLLWNRLSCWRGMNLDILEGPREDLPGHMFTVLQALLEDRVSDRYAGRALRLMLKRLDGVPFTIDPAYEQPELPPAPTRSHRDRADEDEERERVLRWGASLIAQINERRTQLAAEHAQPSAPTTAAAR